MKTIDKKNIIIAAFTLIIGLLAGWLAFGGNKSNVIAQHKQVENQIKGATVWTCSMHPHIRQNEPGDCPICGMDLIILNDEHSAELDSNAISMSTTALQLANVRTVIVGKMNPIKQIKLNGKVQYDERMVYSQSSHIPGRIEQLMVSFTGEFVAKGQTIAYVYSPELVTAQKELFEAQKLAELQPQLFASAREKLKSWKLSETQIDEILTSKTILENFPIKADIAGYVISKMINLGDYVLKGETIYKIADLSKVWVLFDVYESDMIWIKKGDKINFTIASLPGESFMANITWLDPVIDPATRVAKARIEYINPNGKLKPEMFASGIVDAKIDNKSNALIVPKTAVMWTGKRSLVYVKSTSEQGVSFAMREITLGPSLGNSFIVENGIKDGEEIAVSGTFSIDAAAQLAGKPSMMSSKTEKVITEHNHSNMEKGRFKPLFDSYLEWKDDLTNDDFVKAQKSAIKMKSILDEINSELSKTDTSAPLMKYLNTLIKSMEHVHHLSDINQIRNAFRPVSATLIEMTSLLAPFDVILYVQHCPMANNNKGADWLSVDKEIRNPYFGSSMLKCGEVKREIK